MSVTGTRYDEVRGSGECLSENLPLTNGQDIVRGEALALVTATGKLKTYIDADKASAPFYGIAVADADASGGELPSVGVYTKGNFNGARVKFYDVADEYGGFTDQQEEMVEEIRAAARAIGIYFDAFVEGV